MKTIEYFARQLTHYINVLLGAVCSTILVVLVSCMTYQVTARNFLGGSSTVLDEFSQILFMWLILLGGVYAAGLKRHLAIDFIANKLPFGIKFWLDKVIHAITITFASLFMVYGGRILMQKSAFVSQVTPALRWHMEWIYVVMPIGGILLIYYSLFHIFYSSINK
ncbi:C4-dicarboxylate ABC transporter permease [Gammaproteobacteria bacterium]|nr:C4-dicarboxylate ABC transporter permease [Gammaproteobacteria bacterium]